MTMVASEPGQLPRSLSESVVIQQQRFGMMSMAHVTTVGQMDTQVLGSPFVAILKTKDMSQLGP